jgi:hypothetical protein
MMVYGQPDYNNENQKQIIQFLMQNNCLLQQLVGLICQPADVTCLLEQLICNQNTMISSIKSIQMSIATAYPTVVQGEYPEVTDQGIIYHYSGVLREVVGNIVVIFRGKIDQDLPVYLADSTGYAHIVTAPGDNDQLTGNNVVVNVITPAIYEGNYIHLQ